MTTPDSQPVRNPERVERMKLETGNMKLANELMHEVRSPQQFKAVAESLILSWRAFEQLAEAATAEL